MAIQGGADTIQLREKTGSTKKMIETARNLKKICGEAGVLYSLFFPARTSRSR